MRYFVLCWSLFFLFLFLFGWVFFGQVCMKKGKSPFLYTRIRVSCSVPPANISRDMHMYPKLILKQFQIQI